MNYSVSKFVTLAVMFSILATSFNSTQIMNTKNVDPAFTLTMKVHSSYWQDYVNFIKQHLARIGINLKLVFEKRVE